MTDKQHDATVRYVAIEYLHEFFSEHDLIENVAQLDARVAHTRSFFGDEGMRDLNTEVRALLKRLLPTSPGARLMPCEISDEAMLRQVAGANEPPPHPAGEAMAKLNPKQTKFVAEYLVDLNATQAAIRAGYSVKTAKVIGYENLTKPSVAAAIAVGQAKLAGKLEITAERILAELALLGFSNMEDFASIDRVGSPAIDCSKLSRAQWAAVNSIKVDVDGAVTLKLYDKRIALVDLGKHLGLFNEKVDHKHQLMPGDEKLPTLLEMSREIAFALRLGLIEATKENETGGS